MSSSQNPITDERTLQMLRTAFGKTITDALDDDKVIEIMVNPDGKIWLDKIGDGMFYTNAKLTPEEAERVVRLVGSHINQDVTTESPIVSAELPGNGERFEGLLPPVVTAASFTIRKGAVSVFMLSDYVKKSIINEDQLEALTYAVESRQNILIVGGTSSGKTTLANALLAIVADTKDRVVILEDTRELQCEAEDTIALRTHGKNVQLADLVRSTLRLRPDRIIVGEVRGPEALDMLKAWNTGHPGGIATVHANSATAGLARIEQLILEGVQTVPRALIAEAIDVIVFISGRGCERCIDTIARLVGVNGERYQLEPLAAPSPILKLTFNGDPSCRDTSHSTSTHA
jgi:type IV secretion system protein VirB11